MFFRILITLAGEVRAVLYQFFCDFSVTRGKRAIQIKTVFENQFGIAIRIFLYFIPYFIFFFSYFFVVANSL